jgi:hypothetical protein
MIYRRRAETQTGRKHGATRQARGGEVGWVSRLQAQSDPTLPLPLPSIHCSDRPLSSAGTSPAGPLSRTAAPSGTPSA